MNTRRVFAMVLAAGRGRRMGQLKQLMPYGDGNLLDAVIAAALESPIDGLILVAGEEVAELYETDLPEDCHIAINDNPRSEMIDSVRVGLRCLKKTFQPDGDDGVMILLADQPQVGAGTIATCAETYRLPRTPPDILIATYCKRRGHPTVFSLACLKQIEGWPAGRPLNELAKQGLGRVRELPITTGPMPIDVNTRADYDRLLDS
ncbi:MAG: NTP transferase domain-containing protein [Phycisphaerae bacterium]